MEKDYLYQAWPKRKEQEILQFKDITGNDTDVAAQAFP